MIRAAVVIRVAATTAAVQALPQAATRRHCRNRRSRAPGLPAAGEEEDVTGPLGEGISASLSRRPCTPRPHTLQTNAEYYFSR